jgi:hypothetical protein
MIPTEMLCPARKTHCFFLRDESTSSSWHLKNEEKYSQVGRSL